MYLYSVKQVLCEQRDDRRHPSPWNDWGWPEHLIPQIPTNIDLVHFQIRLNILVSHEANFKEWSVGMKEPASRNQEGDCVILLGKTCCSLPGCDSDVTDKRDFLELLVSFFVCLWGSSLHLFVCFCWVTHQNVVVAVHTLCCSQC